ncbi:Chromate transport protein [Paenibacillus plantiphilus]|uniref:Chromate transport protein n=1 Tax=Paenibacillus plantiphilus TaxID=2905650 RepID=A0ABM9BUP0_9BACL|nr:chromate efflux transporter [Paenibacillus plantiphilus]CAH1194946.1 Chromate transport protein [Paenibacillus plantiphilus]
MNTKHSEGTFGEVFRAALKLGLTSFGGPTAHIGYFREEYVIRRRWLNDQSFADLTALCQFLPGPASSQLGMAIGIGRAGLWGALAAWLGFSLPSALIMLLFALTATSMDLSHAGWLQGLKLAAVAVVALAVWSMCRTLAPDRPRATMAVGSAAAALLIPGAIGQLLPLVGCGLIGYLIFGSSKSAEAGSTTAAAQGSGAGFNRLISKKASWLSLIVFALLLVCLPIAAQLSASTAISLADSSYRAGSLVFGGGHVILPMLENELVGSGPGKLSAETFTAGYGAAQAVPGPLFTFAAYLGGAMSGGWQGAMYGLIALAAIFLPSLLLLIGALPYWQSIRGNRSAQAALMGVNAAVVGILLAALYDPIWQDAVQSAHHFVIVILVFLILHVWKRQPWEAVLFSAIAGWLVL